MSTVGKYKAALLKIIANSADELNVIPCSPYWDGARYGKLQAALIASAAFSGEEEVVPIDAMDVILQREARIVELQGQIDGLIRDNKQLRAERNEALSNRRVAYHAQFEELRGEIKEIEDALVNNRVSLMIIKKSISLISAYLNSL